MRQHIEHLLAALGALGFALFISYFNTGAVIHVAPPAFSSSSLTPISSDSAFATSSAPDFLIPTSTLEELFPKSHATSSPAKVAAVATATPPVQKEPVAPTTPPTPLSAPTSTPATSTPATTENSPLLSTLSKSIVNIICVSRVTGLHSISGSGVIIDSRGIILTVAHVAQSVLLQEYLEKGQVSCVVRMGSPAHSLYLARPIYVSTPWIHENSTTLISSQPTGTGENDFALLAITSGASGNPLPGAFPFVPLANGQTRIGDSVGIGSYGAQNLTTAQVKSSLYPTLVMSTVKNRYTFTTNTVDVLSIAGSAASQEGSSGGAVVNTNGELAAVITTSATTGEESTRELRAITMSHIRRSFEADTGKNFDDFLSTGLSTLVNTYATTAQTLGQFLAQSIGLEN